MTALRDIFDVGIYNLNYDAVALTAWPEAFTGFNSAGDFDPITVHQRREWDFLYHLHGSVYHTLPHDEPLGTFDSLAAGSHCNLPRWSIRTIH